MPKTILKNQKVVVVNVQRACGVVGHDMVAVLLDGYEYGQQDAKPKNGFLADEKLFRARPKRMSQNGHHILGGIKCFSSCPVFDFLNRFRCSAVQAISSGKGRKPYL